MCRFLASGLLALSLVIGAGAAGASGTTTSRGHPTLAKTSELDRLAPGTYTLVLHVGGLRRIFIVAVPPVASSANRALVLVYHGAGDTAVSTMQDTNLLETLRARGDLVAFLQGYQDTWNEGTGDSPAALAHVNDVAYTVAVLDRLRQLVYFDPSRVAAVGFSNGALMVEDLGCRLATRFSLLVPVEGELATETSSSCAPKRPESVYEIHGTADPAIPYDGGSFVGPAGGTTVLSAPDSVARWAQLDGCSIGPVTSTPSGTVSITAYSECRDGVSVVLRTIVGGVHAWPPNIGQLVVQALSK